MCPWCLNFDGLIDEDTLCRPHYAEWAGMSLAELDRMEREQSAELLEWGSRHT